MDRCFVSESERQILTCKENKREEKKLDLTFEEKRQQHQHRKNINA